MAHLGLSLIYFYTFCLVSRVLGVKTELAGTRFPPPGLPSPLLASRADLFLSGICTDLHVLTLSRLAAASLLVVVSRLAAASLLVVVSRLAAASLLVVVSDLLQPPYWW